MKLSLLKYFIPDSSDKIVPKDETPDHKMKETKGAFHVQSK
jgi:hypothetical protein